MSDQTANLIIDLPSRAGQGASALPSVQTLAPSEVVEGLFYHTARSIEELDRAKASAGSAACQAHEQLAFLHLKAATKLQRNDVADIVARWVD